MHLMRIGPFGRERPVACDGTGRRFDLSPLTDDIDGAFLAGDGIARTRTALERRELPEISVGDNDRIGSPVARPMAVLCIGLNYAAHAAEAGSPHPEQPVLFLKHPNTVVGPYDDVAIPRNAAKTDWEVELAIVISKRARYLDSPEQALDHIAGITIANDVTERDFQIGMSGGQWSKGKCCETFTPLGPYLVPVDGVADVQDLRLRLWVNGEIRQDSNTKDMIFGVAAIIHHLSQYVVLEPGDVVSTGTPEGVAMSGRFGFLTAGDVMELEIDGLGRQRQRLIAAPEHRP